MSSQQGAIPVASVKIRKKSDAKGAKNDNMKKRLQRICSCVLLCAALLAAALPAAMIAKRLLSQGFLCAVLCAALALVITDLLHTVLLTFRQGVELSVALSLTGRELAVTVVLSPLVYLLLRSVHNRILR